MLIIILPMRSDKDIKNSNNDNPYEVIKILNSKIGEYTQTIE